MAQTAAVEKSVQIGLTQPDAGERFVQHGVIQTSAGESPVLEKKEEEQEGGSLPRSFVGSRAT